MVEAFGLAGQVLVSSRDGVLSSDESTHYAFDASYRRAVLAAFAEPGHVVTQPDGRWCPSRGRVPLATCRHGGI